MRKNYTDEFPRRAVNLYESTLDATLKGVVADLGVSRGASKEWVDRLDSGTTTLGAAAAPMGSGRPESQVARIARLEAEDAALKAEQRKLAEERAIIRQAAK